MQKVKVDCHSVQKFEWKQTDERTDGDDCYSSANAVCNEYIRIPCPSRHLPVAAWTSVSTHERLLAEAYHKY